MSASQKSFSATVCLGALAVACTDYGDYRRNHCSSRCDSGAGGTVAVVGAGGASGSSGAGGGPAGGGTAGTGGVQVSDRGTPGSGLGGTDAGHDASDASHDASDASHDASDASHDASDASHDASDAGHDTSEASTDGPGGSTQTAEDHRYTDRTGRITINVRTCAPIFMVPGGDEASCGTPDDFVLIGGGVEILDNPDYPGAGAVLARSAPTNECVLWAASWIDRDPKHPVMGRAYSISIRFASSSRQGTYVSADSIREARSCISHKYFADGSTGDAEVPSSAYQLVGGGVANLDWTDFGAPPVAMVYSYPSDEFWHGKGINLRPDHPEIQFRVMSIGLLKFIPDFGYIKVQPGGSMATCGLGHVCASTDLVSPSTGVVTCVGGTALYGGAGRYLSSLVPLVQTNGHLSAGLKLVTTDFIDSDVRADDPSVANQSATLILNASDTPP